MAPVYSYQAKNKEGKEISGNVPAEDSTRVASQLRDQGYFVTSIEEVTEKKKRSLNFNLNFKKRVNTEDLSIFSQQFSVLISAGISLVESLETMKNQTDNSRLREVLEEMLNDIEAGSTLSEAMSKYPNVFPDLYSQLIKAGETGGILDRVLQRLAKHYRRQHEINQGIRSALYYPLVILITSMISVFFLLTNVIPNLVSIFSGYNAKLPLPTRILIFASNTMQNYWWLIIGIFVAIIILLLNYFRSHNGKKFLAKISLKLPVLGSLLRKIAISRFSSTLSLLLASGISLIDALPIVEEVVNNQVIANAIVQAENRLREGVRISKPLEESKEFPPMVIQMIKIGEEAGSLDEMLGRVSDFYEQEVETTTESTVSLIEPVLIVILAIVVGFIAISIVMPIFDMYSLM